MVDTPCKYPYGGAEPDTPRIHRHYRREFHSAMESKVNMLTNLSRYIWLNPFWSFYMHNVKRSSCKLVDKGICQAVEITYILLILPKCFLKCNLLSLTQ